jgi:hypothetical protein
VTDDEVWVTWAGVVEGDWVLAGRPGHQVWWRVTSRSRDEIWLRGSGGTVSGGTVPPQTWGKPVRIRPVTSTDDPRAMTGATALVVDMLGAADVNAPPA